VHFGESRVAYHYSRATLLSRALSLRAKSRVLSHWGVNADQWDESSIIKEKEGIMQPHLSISVFL
jgi:hypothetical protein